MKKLLLALVIFLYFDKINAQSEKEKYTNKFVELHETFKELKESIEKEEGSFDKLKGELSSTNFKDEKVQELKDKKELINDLKKRTVTIHEKFLAYKTVCIEDAILKEKRIDSIYINSNFIVEDLSINNEENEVVEAPVSYSYFNENLIFENDFLGEAKETNAGKVLNEILKQTKEETYFGDITVPKKDQKFNFYEKLYVGGNNQSKGKKRLTINKNKEYKFKEIKIEIKDGSFYDIQVLVEYEGKLLWFENYVGISFFRIAKLAKRNFLFYSQKESNQGDEEAYKKLRIKLSDVFIYKYKIGNNYIPSNLVLELPKKDTDNNETNIDAPAIYQIRQDTYLDKIIELRTYTDFLSLFGESNNSIIQIEGNAEFYIFPFPLAIKKASGQFEILKSVTPHVHYSNFDDENDAVDINNGAIGNRLDLIEKRFLTMGLNLNLLELYHKNYPMKANFFGEANYNLTKAQVDTVSSTNVKALSLGGGVKISSKRLNNFGFDYTFSIKWFDFENFNATGLLNTDFEVPVIKNEAEIFYHPNKNPNQAVFLRLATYNRKGKESNAAFYQFQFGYKFSIGSRKVK